MKWCFIVIMIVLFAVNGLMIFLLKKQALTVDKIEVKAKILQQCNFQLQEMINLKTEFEDSIFPKDSVLLTDNLSDYYTINHFISSDKTLCVFFPNSVCNPCLDSINEILQTVFLDDFKKNVLIICGIDQYKLRKEQFHNNHRVIVLAYNPIQNKERIMNLSSLIAFDFREEMIINNFIVIDKRYLDMLRLYLYKMNK